jgi:creatinine amidohydrolase
MQWENLTATDFAAAARDTGVCVLALMARVPAQPADPLKRMSHLPAACAGIWWYADYPDHYAGDARPASAEKGRILEDIAVSALARFIAAVKSDQSVPGLEREFFSR